MSDIMRVQPFDVLLRRILDEYRSNGSIFGIHKSLFYHPKPDAPFASYIFNHYLATPIGPAAGPHTQLAQNIISAWLCGGRFIELKTVQIMDKLEIPRPCIDLQDEGYNVEWSQELLLEQSVDEYVKAWALIHVLRRLLDFEERAPFGTVFNMSVGYNLEGIQSEPVTRFMDTMADASEKVTDILQVLWDGFPEFADIEIPYNLTDNVTLSTMHGCPPDEIERIGEYLLRERGLHTIVKLNPTLLGKEALLDILNRQLGFEEIRIPDRVFEHDLQYGRAVELIKTLKKTAADAGLVFEVKLSNTLAMANHRNCLPGEEMYMSGRALYPITMNLFNKLAGEFNGDLNVSYSAGADALNIVDILASGALPVTSASDLLKPGGYARLGQWLENLEMAMEELDAGSLEELASGKLENLEEAAGNALTDSRYKKQFFAHGSPKVESGLDLFDCITAPCKEQCAVLQDVPEYAWLIAHGEYDRALEVILSRNPLPGITGYVCTHLCQTRCTRNDYDQPVAIRALKRFAFEQGSLPAPKNAMAEHDHRVAIVGAGPAGLSAAYFLAKNGVKPTIFEARDVPGGMAAIAPHFRIPPEVVRQDIDRIESLGVQFKLGCRVEQSPQSLLDEGYDAVFLGTGFQKDMILDLENAGAAGVFTALEFLEGAALGAKPELGKKVLVIGGGNTAMDCARTAQRLTRRPVTVVYRRTMEEMPAEEEEIEWLIEEGNQILELVSPQRIAVENGRVTGLDCVRNKLGEPGADGRRRPVPIEGSSIRIPADSIIFAIGQLPDVAFLDGSSLTFRKNGALQVDPVTGQAGRSIYAGGDLSRGPAIIIQACADGRKAAESICEKLGVPFQQPYSKPAILASEDIIQLKDVRRSKSYQYRPAMLPVSKRAGFDVVEQSYDETTARAEASRCMQCSTLCDKCVEVCPNRANYTYLLEPLSLYVPLVECSGSKLEQVGSQPFTVAQSRQIIHIDDFCNACGNCATFCVHQGKPYTDKPRLFLNEADFLHEDQNAFMVQGNKIRRRENGQEMSLWVENGILTFENDHILVDLAPDFTVRVMTMKKPFEGIQSLLPAAEMAVIFRGISNSLGFLLL